MRPGTCLADITRCKYFHSQTGGREWAVVPFPLSVLGLLYELLYFNLFEFPLSTKIPSFLLPGEVTHGLHLPRWAAKFSDSRVEIL